MDCVEAVDDWRNMVGHYGVIYGKIGREGVFNVAFDVGDCGEGS